MDKMAKMKAPCACGSGKMGKDCCMKADADMIKGQPCPCGSGKLCETCHMKSA